MRIKAIKEKQGIGTEVKDATCVEAARWGKHRGCRLAGGWHHQACHWRALREQHRQHTRGQHSWKRRDYASSVQNQRISRDLRSAIDTACNPRVPGDRLQGVQPRRGIRTRFPKPSEGSLAISLVRC
jgi:hypothetical protein